MSRVVYVNGEYQREEDAKVSVFDRGFLFADGVYEVTTVFDGKLIDFHSHSILVINRTPSAPSEAGARSKSEILLHSKV